MQHSVVGAVQAVHRWRLRGESPHIDSASYAELVEAARKGDFEASFCVGYTCLWEDVLYDAERYLRFAVEHGHTAACTELARVLSVRGLHQDRAERLRLCESAAAAGDPVAQYDLVKREIRINMDDVPNLLRKSAEGGFHPARDEIARILYFRGAESDLSEASHWLHENLLDYPGRDTVLLVVPMYCEGHGVARNMEKAARLVVGCAVPPTNYLLSPFSSALAYLCRDLADRYMSDDVLRQTATERCYKSTVWYALSTTFDQERIGDEELVRRSAMVPALLSSEEWTKNSVPVGWGRDLISAMSQVLQQSGLSGKLFEAIDHADDTLRIGKTRSDMQRFVARYRDCDPRGDSSPDAS